MPLPLISILMPTFNRADMLEKAVTSLLPLETAGLFTFEVLIVNDGSSDNTAEVVQKLTLRAPALVRGCNNDGKGYTQALNGGLRRCQGEWVALFDDDQLAPTDWLLQLYRFAGEHNLACVGGRRELALSPDLLSRLGPVCRALVGEFLLEEATCRCHAKLHPYGGNMLIKKSAFNAVGTFDENFRTGGCDRDWVLRALAHGIPMGLTPKAVVRHMIAPQRLTADHIKWYSMQFGNSFAHIDWRRWGGLKTTAACVARIGQAVLINFPLLLIASLQRNEVQVLDRKALLWRARAYSLMTLFLLMPNLFRQSNHFRQLEFRQGNKRRGD